MAEQNKGLNWRLIGLRVMAAALVAVVALVLRLQAAERLPIDYDEDDYLRAGQQYAEAIQAGDWAAFTDLNYRTEHPPLAKMLYGVVLAPLPQVPEIPDRPTSAQPASKLPQPHLLAARLSGVAVNTITVLLVALVNPLAGLSLAAHSFTIKYSAQVMLEALPMLTGSLVVLAYERSRVWETGRWNGWLVGAAVALGMTAAGKYLYCVSGVAVLIHWLWMRSKGGQGSTANAFVGWLPGAAAWGALSIAVYLIANPYLWPDPIGRQLAEITYHVGYSQGSEVARANFPPWQPLVWLFSSAMAWHPGAIILPTDILITIFAFAGLPRLWRNRPLYVIWIAVTMGFLLVWSTKWPQYILTVMFPWSLAAGEGLTAHLYEPLSRWVKGIFSGNLRQAVPPAERATSRDLRKALPWLIPGVLAISAITIYPLIYQMAIAMTDLTVFSLKDGIQGGIWREALKLFSGEAPVPVSIFDAPQAKVVRFTGFQIFLEVLVNSGDILVFEVIWTALVVSLQVALGVGVAMLLNRPGVKFKGFWMTLFILPWAIPEFLGALSWGRIFNPSNGWLALASQDIPKDVALSTAAGWQNSPVLTVLFLVIAGTWMGWPLMMLAATAGLKLIPDEVSDAASVDGAGRWQTFWAITAPMLMPLLAPVIILRAISAFNQFYLFFALFPPYPYFTLSTLVYYLATPGYFGGWFGAASTISVITVLVLLGLLVWFDRFSKASEGVTYA